MKISGTLHIKENKRKKKVEFMEIFQFACVCFILALIYIALIIADRTSTPVPIWLFVLPIVVASPLLLAFIYDHYFGK